MKIAVIAAGGNLGKKIVRQALDRGHEVKGFVHHRKEVDDRAVILEKSLFDMTAEDITDCDAVISAFGSGFETDPVINLQSFLKYIELNQGSDRHMIVIAGSGSLYMDASHSVLGYEAPGYPSFMKEISRNTRLGIEEIKKSAINWTVMCASQFFDQNGPLTGKYQVGTEECHIRNERGDCYLTYEDMAMAMIDCAEAGSYQKQVVTIGTL